MQAKGAQTLLQGDCSMARTPATRAPTNAIRWLLRQRRGRHATSPFVLANTPMPVDAMERNSQ